MKKQKRRSRRTKMALRCKCGALVAWEQFSGMRLFTEDENGGKLYSARCDKTRKTVKRFDGVLNHWTGV